jgi:leucyl aminopeptidase
MRITYQAQSLASYATQADPKAVAPVWVLPCFTEDLTPASVTLSAEAQWLDDLMDGAFAHELTHHATDKSFGAKVADLLPLSTFSGTVASRQHLPHRVLWLGLGSKAKLDAGAIRKAYATAAKTCQRMRLEGAVMLLPNPADLPVTASVLLRVATEGLLLGAYRYPKPVSPPDTAKDKDPVLPPAVLDHVVWLLPAEVPTDGLDEALHLGQTIAQQTNVARTWVMSPPNVVTPDFLAEQAKHIASTASSAITCTILDAKDTERLGMGAFRLVAQGSDDPHYLLHLRYTPKTPPLKTIALVGKGITFDSGGLSLKPAGAMETMKMDMAGAAVVLCTIQALGLLSENEATACPYQVDVYAPVCNNMPSGRSSKPGDVVTAMNGKTIEVNNTDAEGRLILCDALTYAQRNGDKAPDEIIDLATLTGACVAALGKVAAGAMGTSQTLIEGIQTAGQAAGEKFWPLPLYDDYEPFLKSDVADLINSGSRGEAGSSAGGMFLKQFIEADQAWVHLDIAGPAYTSKESAELPKGGTGFGVRTLLYYLYNLKAC